ncbi:hypothetical protein [Paenarthrobacter ilicis]|uniref:hypothetical protein n=1 Tax=Paenarthrobacter ilicis TaxID=43665 RepID=UPI003868AC50
MPVKAHHLGPGTLKIGETGTAQEWGAQITNAKIAFSLNEEDPTPVLSGEELDGDDTLTSELSGTVLQSYDVAGLVYWSKENALAKLPFDFVPNSADSEFGARGVVKIVPLDLGGDVKKRNTSDFKLKCIGDVEYYTLP